MNAGSGRGTDGDDAPAAAHGLVRDAAPVRPGIDGAAVHHERPRDVDRALRARCRQGPGAAERQVAPHLHAALRDVRIGRMRLRHRVAPGKRHDQVAVGADASPA